MKWHKVEDKLPDRTTKYAGLYAISILVYDEQEAEASGSYIPHEISYSFENNRFEELAWGPNGTEWLHAFWVSHWCEIPEGPQL